MTREDALRNWQYLDQLLQQEKYDEAFAYANRPTWHLLLARRNKFAPNEDWDIRADVKPIRDRYERIMRALNKTRSYGQDNRP